MHVRPFAEVLRPVLSVSMALTMATALSCCRSFDTMDPGAAPRPTQAAGAAGGAAGGAGAGAGRGAGQSETTSLTRATPASVYDVVFSEQGDEVFVNGQRVPDSNLRREPDAIEVLGHDGSVVKRIQLPAPPHDLRPRAFLGAQLRWPSPALASQLGIDPTKVTEVGAVLVGGPAAAAGVREHDLIVKVDGSDDASPATIRARLAKDSPGATIALTVEHAGQRREVLVTLGAWRHQPLPSAPIQTRP